MIINGGLIHKGENSELVVLSDPYFVELVLDFRNPEGDMPDLRRDFLRLISLFDQKKFIVSCRNCRRPAKILTFYKSTLFHEPWCGICIPHWMISHAPVWDTFCDYFSALEYVHDFCHSDKFFYRAIIKNIAMAKGLPDNFGPRDAAEFFAPESIQCPGMEMNSST